MSFNIKWKDDVTNQVLYGGLDKMILSSHVMIVSLSGYFGKSINEEFHDAKICKQFPRHIRIL